MGGVSSRFQSEIKNQSNTPHLHDDQSKRHRFYSSPLPYIMHICVRTSEHSRIIKTKGTANQYTAEERRSLPRVIRVTRGITGEWAATAFTIQRGPFSGPLNMITPYSDCARLYSFFGRGKIFIAPAGTCYSCHIFIF